MRHIDILLTNDIEGGIAPFRHGELEAVFHRWTNLGELPLLEGALWAFVDWVLPDISGLELCRRLRCDPLTAQAHITMILDEDDQESRRRALRTGADDYMVGPVDRAALLDRVLSLQMRDHDAGALRAVTLGHLTIDLAAFQARWQGKPIPLMPNEFRLLRYFVEHPGRVFTRSQLIAALGKQEPPVDERTVDVWIGRLRRALRAAGAGNPLRTVRSLGYVFDSL
ncbi:response regulator transcription factor [Novosphingobium sp. JCM 18896]|uniref:response regulator transcription factor n=1 Tax=Novosphingobium sp. JCM 18896 TaxID=2989731 RepID=UPI002221F2E5|nr:response regulator transcription factor [Novosphingobium sp. JCM 18896]MCW1429853.1 response regulator transcription factor [Novosphingobium sp. JCM 18896]